MNFQILDPLGANKESKGNVLVLVGSGSLGALALKGLCFFNQLFCFT